MSWSNKKRMAGTIGLLGTGAVAGAIAAAVIPASATTSTTTASGSSSTASSGSSSTAPTGSFPPHGSAAHEAAEKAVTGADATKAQAAAVKSVGSGTAGAVTTDFSGTGYEVTVTKSDGSTVEVHLDSTFAVRQGGPGGGPGGGGPGGGGPGGGPEGSGSSSTGA